MKYLLSVVIVLAFWCSPAQAQVTHVTGGCTSAANSNTNGSGVYTFSCTPNAANDAIIFSSTCSATSTPTASISATGWTFTALTAPTGSTANGFSATWGAIAPNTSATTFTLTWSNCVSTFVNHMNDEFSLNDTTGGATTFYASNQATGSGGCSGAAVTSASANDAVWGACNDNLAATNWQGTGWTKGVTDAASDGTEFKNASGSQTPTWASTTGGFVQMTAVIKAAGAGGGGTVPPPQLMMTGVGR